MIFNINETTNWEEHFLQEALELEMKMKEMEADSLSKSKLRIALEQNILSWEDFSKWYSQAMGCCTFKGDLDDEKLDQFINKAKIIISTYSDLNMFNEDLVPLMQWNGNTYVAGLQYSEKLMEIENLVFILAPPQILSYLHFKISGAEFNFEKAKDEMPSGLNLQEQSASSSMFGPSPSFFDKINEPDISAASANAPSLMGANTPSNTSASSANPIVSFDFSGNNSSGNSSNSSPPLTNSVFGNELGGGQVIPLNNQAQDKYSQIWDFLSERHHEYNFEVRKSFDAFVVLKINKGKTQVFKMDHDLVREGVSTLIFEYEINKTAPFKTVQISGRTENFAAKDLNMNIGQFNSVCITPLRRGRDVIGFFLGLKRGNLSDQHKQFLTELADEVAAS